MIGATTYDILYTGYVVLIENLNSTQNQPRKIIVGQQSEIHA